MKTLVSSAVYKALRDNGSSKNGETIIDNFPSTLKQLKEHFESLFESWMNWDNLGKYNRKTWNDNAPTTWRWQIDHITPHSDFKYTSMDCDEFRECWNLSNLRPYSAKQNVKDGNRRNKK